MLLVIFENIAEQQFILKYNGNGYRQYLLNMISYT